MKKNLTYTFLVALFLLGLHAPAQAQRNALINVFYVAPGGDCSVVACTSASKRMCRNSGTSTTLFACDTSTGFYVPVASGGGGSPGGSNTHVQFNDSAAFGGDAGLVYNKTTDVLTVAGGLTVSAGTVSLPSGQIDASEAAASFAHDNEASTFTALQTLSGGVTVSGTGVFKRTNIKTVEICPVGCQYTTLNAACAAETSTTANPILYLIGPGSYNTANTSCTGEDSATIRGAGMGVTIMDNTIDNTIVIHLGNSRNMTVENMTLKGNAGIRWAANEGAGGGGGINYVRNVDFDNNPTLSGGQDCVLIAGTAVGGGSTAGSEYQFEHNICRMGQDGWAVVDDPNADIYSSNNLFEFTHALTDNVNGRATAFLFKSIPCRIYSVGDTFDLTATYSVNHNDVYGGLDAFIFDGQTANCATAPVAEIRNASIKIVDNSANAVGSLVAGIRVMSTATALTSLDVIASTINTTITNDATQGVALGIDVANATTVVSVYGTRIRTSGGLLGSRYDLKGNVAGSILVEASDWLTDNGSLTPIDMRRLIVGTSAIFNDPATITYRTTATNQIGMLLDNTDEAADETSPYFCIRDSTSAAEENQLCFKVDAGSMNLYGNSFALRQELSQAGFLQNYGSIRAKASGAVLWVGDGSASDGNHVLFDAATTDGDILWNDTTDEFVYTGGNSTGGLALDDQLGLRLREEDAGGDNYVELKAPAALAANRTHILNIVDATCTGDGNGGALTIVAGEIVCSADDGGAGGSGDPVLIEGNAVTDAAGVDLLGGTGITATFNGAGSPDTGTFSFTPAEIVGTTTWGAGAGQAFVWDAGATDPTFTFSSNSVAITNAATFTLGGSQVVTAATDDDVPESGDFGALTGGAGITNTAGTLATASGETDFLASGALTCTTAQQGRVQVHTTPLQYCDNAATPALQYAAYGNSAGAATGVACGSACVSSAEADATFVLDSESPTAADIGGTFSAGLTVSANAVAMPGDTTGNYASNVADGSGIDVTGTPAEDYTATVNLLYTDTLAGNPAMNADECRFSTDGTGGGLICEGAADTIEGLLVWNPTGTDRTLTLPDATDTLVGVATGATFSNKTLDVEGTGNVVTTVSVIDIDAASCVAATATRNWDDAGTGDTAPTAACNDTGSIQRPSADFSGSAVNSFERTLAVPADWTGNIDLSIRYVSVAASPTGNVEWDVSTVCRAPGETWDAAFNAIQTITDAVAAQNVINDATQAAITTTGCAASEVITIKVSRDGTNDTNNDLAKMLKAIITLRRSQ